MKRFLNWLRGRKESAVETIKYRSILFGALYIDQQRHDESFEDAFSSAKKISDFVGMFLRLSFMSLISSVFLIASQRREGLISAAYGVCWVYSIGLLFALQLKVGNVILLYLARDIPKHENKIVRIILAIIALVTNIVLIAGIYAMMYELVQHNPFLRDMAQQEPVADVVR